MQARSTRLAALLAVAAALTVFTLVIGAQTRDLLARSGVVACGSQQADDDDDEQARQQQQQSLDDMIQSEQQDEQQNEAAEQQAQLDEQLASQ
ncbi:MULTISPECIES: hypothetical protein [unclassified Mycobacterium]|uniref:hypothetical protein n=1 Tax=unclassified Mycobacterium TaxID=2642494 RepID=UPI0029C75044|nr:MULTISPECIES: hypothetical protein [unclassified Mycobacterium]